MARRILPLLWGVCILQLQCHTGYAQYYQQYEPYKSSQTVSTSFINQPISPVTPYKNVETTVNRGMRTIDQAPLVQQFSYVPNQVTYTFQDGRLTGQQQPFFSTGQSTLSHQQSSNAEYLSLAPETQTMTSQPLANQNFVYALSNQGQLGTESSQRMQPNFIYTVSNQGQVAQDSSQQLSQPNYIYTVSNQGQVIPDVERTVSVSLPIQHEKVYPIGGQFTPQNERLIPRVQFSPKFVPSRIASAPSPAPTYEMAFPFTNKRPSLPERDEVIEIGGKPFVIRTIKTKTPRVSESAEQNPLESLRAEDIIQSILNRRNGGVRSNKIIINNVGETGLVEEINKSQPALSTQPAPVTESTTESPPSTPTSPPEERTASTTTPAPTTTTTTLPPPPPVHKEVTTTEEHHYVSKKKLITISIRVEDASPEDVEKNSYFTSGNNFYHWEKTILEPTDILEETQTYFKNDTREVEGPSNGFDLTKVICRIFVDDQEPEVIEKDPTKESIICPRPTSEKSWGTMAFSRVQNAIQRKLGEMFEVRKNVSEEADSRRDVLFRDIPKPFIPTGPPVSAIDTIPVSEFLPSTVNVLKQLRESPGDFTPINRYIETSKHFLDTEDLQPTTTDTRLTADLSREDDEEIPTNPNQTSKRETRPGIIEKVNLEVHELEKDLKTKKVIAESPVSTTPSHIMVITRTPPSRPPNPYPHPTTAVPPTIITKINHLPAPQSLLSTVLADLQSVNKENKERTFFRPST